MSNRSCDKTASFTEKDIPDLTGYVVIVTGGNSGIGLQTAQQLALRNARVCIASRSEQRVRQAIDQMRKSNPGQRLDLRFLELDLQDLASVKATAKAFALLEEKLDILVHNAGVMATPYQLTKDGYERQWQVNYLSPFLMTYYLLPLLLRAAAQSGRQDRARVVNVSSDMAFALGPKKILWDDVNMTKTKGMLELQKRYSHSKQAAIRSAKELNDRYSSQGVTAYSVHPGIIKSNLQQANGTFIGKVSQLSVALLAKTTPLEGSYNTLFCATSSEAPKFQGSYFEPVGKRSPKAETWLNEKDDNARLWNYSEA
ncbi:uncharacterized protein LTR77_003491 [Saxophila tyrrhenica]|uniref:Uncharacterized protein n=1 Tax=Saxophila tyrrhenica TaxID=1690608 RepID=A0AAV9PDT9_9PEZI|nr:hypothetical protein LTR77_003491 [Saxophila tyrrhenica]